VVFDGRARVLLGAPERAKLSFSARWQAFGRRRHWAHTRRRRRAEYFTCPRGTPYLPRGSLREVLAYPLKADSFKRERFYARAIPARALNVSPAGCR